MNKEELIIKTTDKIQNTMFKLSAALEHMPESEIIQTGKDMDAMADMLDGKET